MSKQLLVYSDTNTLSRTRHRDWSVKSGSDYNFAKEVNSVPLTAVEFPSAADEYPIVFAGDEDNIMPVAVMGLRSDENLFVDAAGKLDAKYTPAFLRRYPFVFSSSDDGENFTLCLDESFAGCNQKNVGERLFDSEGEQTQYLQSILEFLKEYQVHFTRTEAFCKKLLEFDLLQPMGAEFSPGEGARLTLSGFMAIDRDRLKALSADQLQELVQNDGLELAYIHLQSMRNFTAMLSRLPAEVAENKSIEKEAVENETPVEAG
ncbi:MAG: SapC family protein [Gammaproteobacteria bacterium]|nr:SapC family protein [Gammaproteobacteria bacterium]MBT7369041.1 SapC family protein [Gammaproteobacteria bacterium]